MHGDGEHAHLNEPPSDFFVGLFEGRGESPVALAIDFTTKALRSML